MCFHRFTDNLVVNLINKSGLGEVHLRSFMSVWIIYYKCVQQCKVLLWLFLAQFCPELTGLGKNKPILCIITSNYIAFTNVFPFSLEKVFTDQVTHCEYDIYDIYCFNFSFSCSKMQVDMHIPNFPVFVGKKKTTTVNTNKNTLEVFKARLDGTLSNLI